MAAGEHAPGHEAHGVEVGAPVHRRPQRLLRREVLRGPDHQARLRVADGGGVGDLGDPEVQDLRRRPPALGHEEDVLGLQVAVDHAARVRRLEARADLHQQRDGVPGVEPPAPQPLEEALALEQLHRQEQVPLGTAAEVGDPDDVVVLERGRDLRLAAEALDDVGRAGEVLAQELQRQLLAHVDVLGLEHRPHAALGQQRHQAVASVHHRAHQPCRVGLSGRRVRRLGHVSILPRAPRAPRTNGGLHRARRWALSGAIPAGCRGAP
jgi:hypothetical protein